MVLFISPANRVVALGASLSAIGLQWKIHEKIFSEFTSAKASVFGMQHCYVEFYINPAKPLSSLSVYANQETKFYFDRRVIPLPSQSPPVTPAVTD